LTITLFAKPFYVVRLSAVRFVDDVVLQITPPPDYCGGAIHIKKAQHLQDIGLL